MQAIMPSSAANTRTLRPVVQRPISSWYLSAATLCDPWCEESVWLMALFQRCDGGSRRRLIGLAVGGALQRAHVGNDGPAIRSHYLKAIRRHGAAAVGDHVED